MGAWRSVRERLSVGLGPRVIGLAMLAVLVTGGLIGTFVIENSRSFLREDILGRNLGTADLAGNLATNFVEGAEASLRQLAVRTLFVGAVLDQDLEQAERHMEQVMQIDPRFDNIAVYTADGIGWASGLKSQWLYRGGSVTDREWFQQTLTTRASYLGIPIHSRGTGRPIVSYTIPIFDDTKELRAVLVGGISLAALADMITGALISESARASLLDSRQGGMVVADVNPDRILQPVPGQDEAASQALAGKRGTLETRSSSGELGLAAFAPVPRLPWSVLILEPAQIAFAPVSALTERALLLIGVILLAALITSVLLARRITSPLRHLVKGATEVGSGNLDYRLGTAKRDEIGAVSGAFDRMTEELKTTLVSRDDLANEVAERSRAEEKLREANESLEDKNAELERFSYTVSHDLRSPLVTVKTFLGYLAHDLEGSDAGRIEKDLFYMHGAADKMGQLLDELLEMSRIGRLANPPSEVTFKELTREAVNMLAGSITDRGVDVRVGDADVALYGDRPRLVEIWQNLIENAVKFMGAESAPRVDVDVERGDRETRFFVRDNGIGIDPRHQSKAFGLFEKLDSQSEGTGIGLALVKRIVELNRGRIWVESQGRGQGTSFWFTLPAAVKDELKGDHV